MKIDFGYNPAPKPEHKRGKPKRGQYTAVTDRVRKEVKRRSMEALGYSIPGCERCGAIHDLTTAHIENASQYGAGGVPWNIILICGTHGMKGTCHDWADNTRPGRAWKVEQEGRLREYYESGNGRQYWRYEE